MYKLRPHHGLCSAFFCGHGYSEAFTANMAEKLALFRRNDPYITLTIGEDCICQSCPHNCAHICDAAERVTRYDNAVLAYCGLSAGNVLRWSAFCNQVDREILDRGSLREICGDCAWISICEKGNRNR